MYFNIKNLSRYLSIKPSTLYAWVSQGRIPHLKIHGLIRFEKDEIDRWLQSFSVEKTVPLKKAQYKGSPTDVEAIIARAKGKVYNTPLGETGPISSALKGGK